MYMCIYICIRLLLRDPWLGGRQIDARCQAQGPGPQPVGLLGAFEAIKEKCHVMS